MYAPYCVLLMWLFAELSTFSVHPQWRHTHFCCVVCVSVSSSTYPQFDFNACFISWHRFSNVCQSTKLQRHNYFTMLILPARIGLMNPASRECLRQLTVNKYRCHWLAQPVTMATPAHGRTPPPPPPRHPFPPPPSSILSLLLHAG